MQARKIGEGVWWVGAMDWDRRLFDGYIPFEDLPEQWVCPVCRVHKSMFRVQKH